MSNPDIPSSVPSSPRETPTNEELRGAIETLRGVFQVAALSGIVLSAALFLFLYKEVSVVRRQNSELATYIIDYNTNVAPKIEMSRTNLEAFARTNPSIVPILKKYFPSNAPAASTPASKP
jgi:hypothetical protein